jgi:hypothetical protein
MLSYMKTYKPIESYYLRLKIYSENLNKISPFSQYFTLVILLVIFHITVIGRYILMILGVFLSSILEI